MNQGGSMLGDRDRAQTVQDFAVGASVFLLTVSFVFAFVPSLFTPFSSEISPGAPMQADRVSDQLVSETSMVERPNWLDVNKLSGIINSSATGDELQNHFTLPESSQINVTLLRTDGSGPVTGPWAGHAGDTVFAAGNNYYDRPASSVSRIVAVPGIDACDLDESPASDDSQGCRLVVRIW